jgi:hypothetical protein
MAASGLKVAPLRRRLAAGAIDAVVVVGPIGGAVGGAAWLRTRYRRWRGQDDEAIPELRQDRRWGTVSAAASAGVQVGARNWRSPGYRALGLRRVDVRTGGPVTVRSAIIQAAVSDLLSRTIRSLIQPWQARRMERLQAIQAEMKEAQRTHAGDREAQQRALMEIFKRENVNPLTSCLPAVLVGTLPQVTRVRSPLNQTLPERLAGTVVVRDD